MQCRDNRVAQLRISNRHRRHLTSDRTYIFVHFSLAALVSLEGIFALTPYARDWRAEVPL